MSRAAALFFLSVFYATPVFAADDPQCVRMPCLGECMSREEAQGKAFPMLCMQQAACYADVDCVGDGQGHCRWRETPGLAACIAQKTQAPVPITP